jgi:aryl-alcohol dehydrogenase-like predicted oxidoreductase
MLDGAPRIGLGTNRLTNTPENAEFLRAAVAAGLRHVDTAHLYTSGESETAIGAALSPAPDGVVVATKGGYRDGRPEVLRAELDQSLRSLGTERIDLYYLHRVDRAVPLEESLGALAEARDAGKVDRVGISEVSVEQVERAREVVPIAAVQNHYNLAERGSEDVVDHCADQGIAFVPYFPLREGGGAKVSQIAERHGATESQIALAWLLRRSPAMLPIPGTLSLEHLRENLAASQIELSDEEFEALR